MKLLDESALGMVLYASYSDKLWGSQFLFKNSVQMLSVVSFGLYAN